MPTNKSSQNGYGGIETYCLVEGSNNNNGCTAFVGELESKDVRDIQNQFDAQQSDWNMSGKDESSVFKRAKKLRRLLSR